MGSRQQRDGAFKAESVKLLETSKIYTKPPVAAKRDKMDGLVQAINLLGATDAEKEALLEILDFEGFGGAEYDTDTTATAERKLAWLRQQIEDGHR